MQTGKVGERKAMKPWEIGIHFHREKTERERERGKVQHIGIICKKRTPLECSWRERERKRAKTLSGDWTRSLSPKTIDGEEGEGFKIARVLQTVEHRV